MNLITDLRFHRVSLSLVMPAYDEAEGIAQVIREADAALSRIVSDYEIIVVDDGSRDGTATEVRRTIGSCPQIRLVAHECHRGYGAALRSGLTAARFPLVALCDADGQFDLAELAGMIPRAAKHHVVWGYRIGRRDPAYRRWLAAGYNWLVKRLLGSTVRDCDCALKLFRREVIALVAPNADDYFANMEMLWHVRRHRLALVECGVQHRPRRFGRSKVSLLDVPRTLLALLPFWWSHVLFPRVRDVSRAIPAVSED
jgi:dolichol-phosphate mannosyltransferase